MGRLSRYLRQFAPQRRRTPIGTPEVTVDLTGLRNPDARYREPQPPRPVRDPLLSADTSFPHVPDPYHEEQHYGVLGRRPYSFPPRYAPHDPAWQYDDSPSPPLFDGCAGTTRDPEPRERIPRYEDGVLAPGESEELIRQAIAMAAFASRDADAQMLDPLPSLAQSDTAHMPALDDEPYPEQDSLAHDVFAQPQQSLSDHVTALDAPAEHVEQAYGGLEQRLFERRMEQAWAEPALMESAFAEPAADETSAMHDAFDRQLEDMTADFERPHQALLEPEPAPAAVLDPMHELPPPDRAGYFMPPGMGPL